LFDVSIPQLLAAFARDMAHVQDDMADHFVTKLCRVFLAGIIWELQLPLANPTEILKR